MGYFKDIDTGIQDAILMLRAAHRNGNLKDLVRTLYQIRRTIDDLINTIGMPEPHDQLHLPNVPTEADAGGPSLPKRGIKWRNLKSRQ